MSEIRDTVSNPNALSGALDRVSASIYELRLRMSIMESCMTKLGNSAADQRYYQQFTASAHRVSFALKSYNATLRCFPQQSFSPGRVRHPSWASQATSLATAATRSASRLAQNGYRYPCYHKIRSLPNPQMPQHQQGEKDPTALFASAAQECGQKVHYEGSGTGSSTTTVVVDRALRAVVQGGGRKGEEEVSAIQTGSWSADAGTAGSVGYANVALDAKRALRFYRGDRTGAKQLALWLGVHNKTLVQPCEVCMRGNVPRTARDGPPVLRDYATLAPLHKACAKSLLTGRYKK